MRSPRGIGLYKAKGPLFDPPSKDKYRLALNPGFEGFGGTPKRPLAEIPPALVVHP